MTKATKKTKEEVVLTEEEITARANAEITEVLKKYNRAITVRNALALIPTDNNDEAKETGDK